MACYGRCGAAGRSIRSAALRPSDRMSAAGGAARKAQSSSDQASSAGPIPGVGGIVGEATAATWLGHVHAVDVSCGSPVGYS